MSVLQRWTGTICASSELLELYRDDEDRRHSADFLVPKCVSMSLNRLVQAPRTEAPCSPRYPGYKCQSRDVRNEQTDVHNLSGQHHRAVHDSNTERQAGGARCAPLPPRLHLGGIANREIYPYLIDSDGVIGTALKKAYPPTERPIRSSAQTFTASEA